jgi:hypothetical protein
MHSLQYFISRRNLCTSSKDTIYTFANYHSTVKPIILHTLYFLIFRFALLIEKKSNVEGLSEFNILCYVHIYIVARFGVWIGNWIY